MKYTVNIADREYEVEIARHRQDPNTLEIKLGDKVISTQLHRWKDKFTALVEGQSMHFHLEGQRGAVQQVIHLNGHRYPAKIADEHTLVEEEEGPVDGVYTEHSPMPGLIKEIKVQPGDQLEVGQTLLIMEAMKMEMEIKARFAGQVEAVLVEVGASVQEGDNLVKMEVG